MLSIIFQLENQHKQNALRIVFVCTGNTCRSPIAEALCMHEIKNQQLPIKIEPFSAGLMAIEGEVASELARQLMAAEGINLESHRARNICSEMIDNADLILAMTDQHCQVLLERYPQAVRSTYTLKTYAGFSPDDCDIEDPYLGNPEKYKQVIEEIRVSIKKIIHKLSEEYKNDHSPGK